MLACLPAVLACLRACFAYRGSGGGSSRRGSADSASSDGLALACSTNSAGGAIAGAAAIGSSSSSGHYHVPSSPMGSLSPESSRYVSSTVTSTCCVYRVFSA
jgi:hypothetical protein